MVLIDLGKGQCGFKFEDTYFLFRNEANGTVQVKIREENLVPELKDSVKRPLNDSQFAWIPINDGKEGEVYE